MSDIRAPSNPNPGTAVLLVAHGSRRESANDDLRRLAKLVAARGEYPIVEIAFLELAEPTIPQGATTCVDRGAQTVLMLPYFLSAGEHAAGDLERYRTEFSAQYPNVEFVLCPPLGVHPLLVDIVFERLREGESA